MSWDESQETFIAEEFTRDAMTVASGPTFKRRPSGLRSAVVMTNRAGHAIEALLRWKNDNCLLGPAWQVSLRA